MISVIFDMDGTLLNTQRIYIPAWDYAGEKQGIKGAGEHVKNCLGNNEARWKKYVVDTFVGINLEKFCEDVKFYLEQNMVVKYMPGAEELLRFFKSKGIRMAIASGSPRDMIAENLKIVGGEEFFEITVGGPDVLNSKPAPDIFLLAAEKLGVDPADCFVIEDSENGLKAGIAAGMKAIGIPDVAEFGEEIKRLITAEFSSLLEALDYFKTII